MQIPTTRLHSVWPFAAGLSLLVYGATAQGAAEAAPTPEQVAFFESKVRPVLVDNCFKCHGPKMQMAGLRVDSLEGLLKGGDSGPSLVRGDASKSLLVKVVHYNGPIKMPKGKKLPAAQIADLETWVNAGAPWPKVAVQTKKQSAQLWSLLPVTQPTPPKVRNEFWVSNPIDAFVMSKLEAKKIKPASVADRRTLLRRLSYDLTGLPPSAAEVQAFLGDRSPRAYSTVVDRLLASPRYGERWARLWLDVARYADTMGYMFEEDRTYHNAYTYRDWVINAFNTDLPYDQFIIQQLAADRLPQVQNGDDKTALAAMGFLTVGRRFLNNQPDIIDDRIDVTMRGFQGFTVSCARCHDHKFDPIPTQDYYSLYGVFASSAEATPAISPRSVREPWEQHNKKVGALDRGIKKLIADQVARLRKDEAGSADIKGVLQGLREGQEPDAPKLAKLLVGFEPAEQERLKALNVELVELKKKAPPTPEFAMAMVDRGDPGDGRVFRRGNPGNLGEPAPRRFLAALTKAGADRELWTKGSGRYELAASIASENNPLTARVLVNRVWQHHFGQGIVRTPSDFGHQGEKPTHPELLDYLASTFVKNGWSIKKLHRLIVMSSTYRQGSAVTREVYTVDPDNRLLSRMNRRRLDLEQMRDSVLLAAGKLDLTAVGGKSVDLWKTPFSTRRAVYGFVDRQNLPGVFRTFDFASPDATSAGRFMTSVPQQALFFLNSPFVVEQAKAVAERADVKAASDHGQQLRRMYLLMFGRLPSAEELAAGAAYLARKPSKDAPSPVALYAQALMMTNEFLFVD